MQYNPLWNESLGVQQNQNSTSLGNYYTKMEDFDIMTQNSILIDFRMDSIIENVKLELIRNP